MLRCSLPRRHHLVRACPTGHSIPKSLVYPHWWINCPIITQSNWTASYYPNDLPNPTPRSGILFGQFSRREYRYEDAKRLFEEVLSVYETNLDLNTLLAVVNLTLVYDSLLQTDEAEQLYRRALTGLEKKPGFDLRVLSGVITNFANFYSRTARFDEAVELCKRASMRTLCRQ